MLAQNFLPSATLGITDIEHEGLVKVLALLEQEKLPHAPLKGFTFEGKGDRFNMVAFIENDCGTVACIAGWANQLTGGGQTFQRSLPDALCNLFGLTQSILNNHRTPAQAAVALRHYLQTGECEPNWGSDL